MVASLLVTAGLVAGGVAAGLTGAAGTYALWSSSVVVRSGATIATGSATLTVDGGSTYALTGLSTPFDPGDRYATTVTVANLGSTALSVSVSATSVATDNSLLDNLTVAAAAVSTAGQCSTAGSGGDLAAPLVGFTSGAFALPSGSSRLLCIVLSLRTTAPAAAARQTGAFTMTLTGIQST